MRLVPYLTLTALALASSFAMAQDKSAAPAPRTLNVKLNYTGSGSVDDKHHIIVFLFDSPDFAQGNGMPIAAEHATAKDATVKFGDLDRSPVYVAAVFDPTGGYDGTSGPPPSGSSLGMYSEKPPEPGAIKIEPGKTAEVTVAFDDTAKMQ